MIKRQKIRKGIILFLFFLFPVVFYYLSPYLIIEATLKGIVNGSFIMFAILFISALVVGRAFCGWVCPAGGGQEALFSVREKKVTKGDLVKWIIWIPWIGAIAVLAVKGGGYSRIDFFYQTASGISISDTFSFLIYLGVLHLVMLPALIVGKRSFCHHICWIAPFMIVGRKIRNIFKWPSLRIVVEPATCKHCRQCTRHCPMSLPVEEMVNQDKMEHTECILCGTCIDGCKPKAIKFAFFDRAGAPNTQNAIRGNDG